MDIAERENLLDPDETWTRDSGTWYEKRAATTKGCLHVPRHYVKGNLARLCPGELRTWYIDQVDGGLFSDDVTGSICMMYVSGCCAETKHSIVVKLGTLTKSTMRY